MKKLVGLSIPVALTYLGPVLMTFVDMIAVSGLGPEAIAAVGLGGALFSGTLLVGRGLLAGLDFFIAHAYGAKNEYDVRIYFIHGLYLAAAFSCFCSVFHWILSWHLADLGVNAVVANQAGPYLRILSFSILPALMFISCRQFLQALGIAKVGMIVVLAANVVNAFGNYLLVYGQLGFPALGVEGSAWATLISRFSMMLSMVAYVAYWGKATDQRFTRADLKYDAQRMKDLLRLGWAGGFQCLLEVGVYYAIVFLATGLPAASSAAHLVVWNIITFTCIIPESISSATAVLTGQALGHGQRSAALSSGWRGIQLAIGYTLLVSAALYFAAIPIMRIYTRDREVVAIGVSLMAIAALVQMFEGTLGAVAGAMRGIGDTKKALISFLIGQWCFGVPASIYLCHFLDMGVQGLWIGFCLGMIVSAASLTYFWYKKSNEFLHNGK